MADSPTPKLASHLPPPPDPIGDWALSELDGWRLIASIADLARPSPTLSLADCCAAIHPTPAPPWWSDNPGSLPWLRELLLAIEANQLHFHSPKLPHSAPLPFATLHPLHALRSICLATIDTLTAAHRDSLTRETQLDRQIYNLAYGLTHEINNPLANISARAQLLLSQSPNQHSQKQLATIIDQAQRAHEMLAELMLTLKQPAALPRTINPVTLLTELAPHFTSLCQNKQIAFTFSYPSTPLSIVCDPDDLKEIAAIATRNAIEACQAGDAIAWTLDQDHHHLVWTIQDNGPGISHQSLNQVWDFYFSGREAGRGLGLGLAKLKRLIQRNQAEATINSSPNAGWKLMIRFA